MSGNDHSYRRERISDPEKLVAVIHGARMVPCQLSERPGTSEIQQLVLPSSFLDLATLGPAMLFKGSMAPSCYTLVFVVKCPTKGRSFNFGIEHDDGYLGIFPPGAALDAYTPEGYSNVTLTIPAPRFFDAARNFCPELPDRLLKHGGALKLPLSHQTAIRRIVADLESLDESGAVGLGHPMARAALEEELLRTFLGALRRESLTATSQPSPRIARRLRRFGDLREHLSIQAPATTDLASLCEVSGLSIRGVEYLFRDYLGVSPTTYLRHQRLHEARRRLLGARQGGGAPVGTVKSIALDLGFWHLGRFARYYRDFFGESPHQTRTRS